MKLIYPFFIIVAVSLMMSCTWRKITTKTDSQDIVYKDNIQIYHRPHLYGMEFSDDGNKLLIWNKYEACLYSIEGQSVRRLKQYRLRRTKRWDELGFLPRDAVENREELNLPNITNLNNKLLPLYDNTHILSKDFKTLKKAVNREKTIRRKIMPRLIRFDQYDDLKIFGCQTDDSGNVLFMASKSNDAKPWTLDRNPKDDLVSLYDSSGRVYGFLNYYHFYIASIATSLDNRTYIAEITEINGLKDIPGFYVHQHNRRIYELGEQDIMRRRYGHRRSDTNEAFVSPSGKYAVLRFRLRYARYINIGGFHGLTIPIGYNATCVVNLQTKQMYRMKNTLSFENYFVAIDEKHNRIAFWTPANHTIRITRMKF